MTAENAAIVVIPVCRMSGCTLPFECIAVRFLLTKRKEDNGNVTEPTGSEERQLPYKTVSLLLIQYTRTHMLLKQGKELSVLTMHKQRSLDRLLLAKPEYFTILCTVNSLGLIVLYCFVQFVGLFVLYSNMTLYRKMLTEQGEDSYVEGGRQSGGCVVDRRYHAVNFLLIIRPI